MDKYLLDTHTLLWFLLGDASLGKKSQVLLTEAFEEGALAVSAISFWEIALLESRNKIVLDESIFSWREKVLDLGIHEYSITGEIGIRSVQLNNFHADPADRLIVATALEYDRALVTADKAILKWGGEVVVENARK